MKKTNRVAHDPKQTTNSMGIIRIPTAADDSVAKTRRNIEDVDSHVMELLIVTHAKAPGTKPRNDRNITSLTFSCTLKKSESSKSYAHIDTMMTPLPVQIVLHSMTQDLVLYSDD